MTKAALKALVVGTGHGARVHAPALRAAGFEVVGVVGADAERTKRRADNNGIPAAFTDLDDAIARTGAIAVTIASPPNTHATLTLAALARGCHVLCEKPFAKDAAEARTLLAAAERAGVVHLMGNQFRLLPERVLAARAIADGLIGAPRLLSIEQYNPLVASPESKMPRWWFDAASGGGWLGASGSHVIDQIRAWLGEFDTVSATLPVVSARENVAEDSFSIRFTLKNGTSGTMVQSGGAWGPSASFTRLAGTDGTLWIEDSALWLADKQGKRQLETPPDLVLPVTPPSDKPGHQFLALELPPAQRLCEAWRGAIEGKPLTHLKLATFADGVACMDVIDAIRASAAQGGALVRVAD
jgi:predicted dehydrogenase